MVTEDLKLVSLSTVNRPDGVFMYGLDEKGRVWKKCPNKVWQTVDMTIEGCPTCGHRKDSPRVIREADGHGGLARHCSDRFHLN